MATTEQTYTVSVIFCAADGDFYGQVTYDDIVAGSREEARQVASARADDELYADSRIDYTKTVNVLDSALLAIVDSDRLATADSDPKHPAPWPAPTQEMSTDPVFNAIWNRIKTWDINVPDVYGGYCGATGNHVQAIMDALLPVSGKAYLELVEKLEKAETELTALYSDTVAAVGKPTSDEVDRMNAEAIGDDSLTRRILENLQDRAYAAGMPESILRGLFSELYEKLDSNEHGSS